MAGVVRGMAFHHQDIPIVVFGNQMRCDIRETLMVVVKQLEIGIIVHLSKRIASGILKE